MYEYSIYNIQFLAKINSISYLSSISEVSTFQFLIHTDPSYLNIDRYQEISDFFDIYYPNQWPTFEFACLKEWVLLVRNKFVTADSVAEKCILVLEDMLNKCDKPAMRLNLFCYIAQNADTIQHPRYPVKKMHD